MSGSKLAVGSSKKSNFGLFIKDFANETLFFCPEDTFSFYLKNLPNQDRLPFLEYFV